MYVLYLRTVLGIIVPRTALSLITLTLEWTVLYEYV